MQVRIPIAVYLFCVIGTFIACAVAAWSINPGEWPGEIREWLALMTFPIGELIAAMAGLIYTYKDEL